MVREHQGRQCKGISAETDVLADIPAEEASSVS
jgi:hypothetical protein